MDTGPNAVFSNVSIDHVPGYPEGYIYKYYLGNTLVSVGSPPAGVIAPGSVQASSQTPGQNTNAARPSSSSVARQPDGGTQAGGQPTRTPADAYSEPITPFETLYQKELNPLVRAAPGAGVP